MAVKVSGTEVISSSRNLTNIAGIDATTKSTLEAGLTGLVADSDIGVTVQAYDSDTAKYDDTTANFTGTLQNGGSNVVVDTDIGSTVQAYDAGLQSISGLTTSANQMIYTTASDTYATTSLTAAGRALLDDASASDQRTTLGLTIGTNVQAWDVNLDQLAGLAATDGNFIVGNGSAWVVESGSTVRTSLGLGSIATQEASNVSITGGSITGITDLAVSDGGTGASSFTANNVLLGNGTSSFQTVAPGTSGNVLTSNGTTWTSTAPTPGYTDADVDTHLNTSTASSGEVLSWTGSDYDWVSGGATDINGLSDGYSDGSSVGLGSGALANDDGTANNNTVVGVGAGSIITSGNTNVLVGRSANLNSATGTEAVVIGAYAKAGGSSVAIGSTAGGSIGTSSDQNVFIGAYSGRYTNNSHSIGLGVRSLNGNSGTLMAGDFNAGIGYETGYDITTGANNFLGGYRAGTNLTTGSNNVALGNGALDAATTGGRNIAIGQDAMGLGVATSASGDNIAIGFQAGYDITTGTDNTLLGEGAGASITTGSSNVFLGPEAGKAVTTGGNNIAIGQNTLWNTTAPANNIAIGTFAMLIGNVSGEDNIAIGRYAGTDLSTGANNFLGGYLAGENITTGSNNVAIGNGALDAATTGGRNIAIGQDAMGAGVATAASGDNVAIGYGAGQAITSGSNNIFVGELAGTSITTASNNIALGANALDAATTGGRNIAIGLNAMGAAAATSANGDNIAIGVQSGDAVSTGTDNTFIGTLSGYLVSSGSNNLLLGNSAALTLTTGSGNMVLGSFAEPSSATVSNEITLGNSSITNLRVPGVGFQFDTTDGLIVPKTVTAAGTTGAQTINKTAGTVNFAAAATSLVVTNSFVDANSIIIATVGTNDATMTSVQAVAAAGSFTLYANAAATAETRVNWFVAN